MLLYYLNMYSDFQSLLSEFNILPFDVLQSLGCKLDKLKRNWSLCYIVIIKEDYKSPPPGVWVPLVKILGEKKKERKKNTENAKRDKGRKREKEKLGLVEK